MKPVLNKKAPRGAPGGEFPAGEVIAVIALTGFIICFVCVVFNGLMHPDRRQKRNVQSLTQCWESQGSVLTSDEPTVVGSHFEGDRVLVWKEAKTPHYLLVSTLAAAGCAAGSPSDGPTNEELNTLVPSIEALQDRPATAAHAKTIPFNVLSQQDRALCPGLENIDEKAGYQGRIVGLVAVQK